MLKRLGVIATIVLAASGGAMADEAAGQRWLDRFLFKPPLVEPSGVCEGRIGALPEFDVTPHAMGIELVRSVLAVCSGGLAARHGARGALRRPRRGTGCAIPDRASGSTCFRATRDGDLSFRFFRASPVPSDAFLADRAACHCGCAAGVFHDGG